MNTLRGEGIGMERSIELRKIKARKGVSLEIIQWGMGEEEEG